MERLPSTGASVWRIGPPLIDQVIGTIHGLYLMLNLGGGGSHLAIMPKGAMTSKNHRYGDAEQAKMGLGTLTIFLHKAATFDILNLN